MLRQLEIQLQRREAKPADESGNQKGCQHGGQDEEQQIVGKCQRNEAGQKEGRGEQQAAPRHFVRL